MMPYVKPELSSRGWVALVACQPAFKRDVSHWLTSNQCHPTADLIIFYMQSQDIVII